MSELAAMCFVICGDKVALGQSEQLRRWGPVYFGVGGGGRTAEEQLNLAMTTYWGQPEGSNVVQLVPPPRVPGLESTEAWQPVELPWDFGIWESTPYGIYVGSSEHEWQTGQLVFGAERVRWFSLDDLSALAPDARWPDRSVYDDSYFQPEILQWASTALRAVIAHDQRPKV